MAIYFLRHGESAANVAQVFAGQKEDSDLTELGIEQAKSAGKLLQNSGIHRIISSRLIRAAKTAEIVAQSLGIDTIEFDDRLSEYDMGILTGTPRRKVTSHELVSAEGAENATAFQERVLSLLREVKNSRDNILLVSHAGVGRIIEASREGLSPDVFYDLEQYPNAQPVKLDLSWID